MGDTDFERLVQQVERIKQGGTDYTSLRNMMQVTAYRFRELAKGEDAYKALLVLDPGDTIARALLDELKDLGEARAQAIVLLAEIEK